MAAVGQLTVACSINCRSISACAPAGLDVASLAQSLDFINIMTCEHFKLPQLQAKLCSGSAVGAVAFQPPAAAAIQLLQHSQSSIAVPLHSRLQTTSTAPGTWQVWWAAAVAHDHQAWDAARVSSALTCLLQGCHGSHHNHLSPLCLEQSTSIHPGRTRWCATLRLLCLPCACCPRTACRGGKMCLPPLVRPVCMPCILQHLHPCPLVCLRCLHPCRAAPWTL